MTAAGPGAGPWHLIKRKVYALVLIAIIVVIAMVVVAAYNGSFAASIPVTVHADRAGLQMSPDDLVKIRGVDLGRVKSVELNHDDTGVDIQLALDPELARTVPSNVHVSLNQQTAFGSKFVIMNYPPRPSGDYLHAGTVVTADHVAVEVNTVFDHLMTLLHELPPSKVNATLGAFAGALQGKGESAGVTLTKLDTYLRKINTNLPQLQRDFRSTAGFSNVYADVAPSLVDVLSNAAVTSNTLADKATDIGGTFRAASGVGREVDDFFGENADPLTDMLRSLRPTTSLLQEYSPALTCFLDGAAYTWDQLNKKVMTEGGVVGEFNFPEGTGAYNTTTDMPTNGPGPQAGPNCRGLPDVKNSEASLSDYTAGPQSLNQKTVDNSPRLTRQPAVVEFFGPDALVPAATGPVAPKGGR
jgi:phospholipid/cholesterol/gamma-HCH transport system substrate-binding protein